MTDTGTGLSAADQAFRLREYESLRDEILQHMTMQDRAIDLAVVGSAAFLTFATATGVPAETLFVLPPLLMFIAINWKQHDLATALLGRYIRENLEPPELGWEKFVAAHRGRGGLFSVDDLVFMSVRGVFLVTQGVALVMAVLRGGDPERHLVLIGLDALAMIVTVLVLRQVVSRRTVDGRDRGLRS